MTSLLRHTLSGNINLFSWSLCGDRKRVHITETIKFKSEEVIQGFCVCVCVRVGMPLCLTLSQRMAAPVVSLHHLTLLPSRNTERFKLSKRDKCLGYDLLEMTPARVCVCIMYMRTVICRHQVRARVHGSIFDHIRLHSSGGHAGHDLFNRHSGKITMSFCFL